MANSNSDISPCPNCIRLVRKPPIVTPEMTIACGHCGAVLCYYEDLSDRSWGWGVIEEDAR